MIIVKGSKRTCFNTQPPEGGWELKYPKACLMKFQHTAARRRLYEIRQQQHRRRAVSTHSRPKAAVQLG